MLNFALVGCGRIAERHSDLLANGHVKGARLKAVCDIDDDKAKLIGNRFKIPYYKDMHEMMSSESIDVVVVLTESGNHAKNVIDLAKYKKHIIVEKPMALSLNDADRMIEACDLQGIRLFVIKQNRYNIPVQKLRSAIENKRFGKLVLGTVRVRWCRPQEYYDQASWRGTWEMDGGVLTNQASHHVDLLEWMMGSVESVQAMSTTALADIETEDTAIVNLRFSNGALGIIEATTAVRPKNLEGSLSIIGEKGSVVIGGFAVNEMKVWEFCDETEDDRQVLENFSENPPNVYGFGHKLFYENVVNDLLNDQRKSVDGIEGRRSLELINAIYESIETKKEVSLRFKPNFSKLGQKNA